jgi:hypothetical protein
MTDKEKALRNASPNSEIGGRGRVLNMTDMMVIEAKLNMGD